MIDARKSVTYKVRTRGIDILNMEIFLDCIILCKKHTGLEISRPERELMTMRYECKDCDKEYRKRILSFRRIYSQLCEEYYEYNKPPKKGG